MPTDHAFKMLLIYCLCCVGANFIYELLLNMHLVLKYAGVWLACQGYQSTATFDVLAASSALCVCAEVLTMLN